jgi:hypothetical protein
MGRPEVDSLVDQTRSWSVPESLDALRQWLFTYSPSGLKRDGSAASPDALTTELAAISFRGPVSEDWESADLEFRTAADGPDASVLRADAVIVWLDPTRLRRCPAPVTIRSGSPSRAAARRPPRA